ncbi:MAG: DNA polymerase Y family protein [Alphaproteobacteria bacterium]|nr:DNA polymerase Y family protein [Alphaproteobacteria bacterium]
MNANSQPRRYLAVWLAHLPTDRIERALSPRPFDPRAIVAEVKSALRLTALNAAAAALGLRAGMPLADARAMHPALAVDHADEAADAKLAEAISDWLTRFTPLVGLSDGGMMLDITGCAHLFGGEEAMRKDIVRRLALQGFTARVSVAGTVGAAWALARFADKRIVSDADLRETLLPLPLAALRLDAGKLDALARVGLKKIADLVDRPRAPLAARFGAILLRRLDQILGTADEPITPRLPVPPYIAERCFAEPVTHEAYILEIVEHLAHDLAKRMEERGEGARALQVTLYRVDGAVRRLSVATSKPLRDARALCRLFRERFATLADELDPGFGFDVVRLSVTTAEKATAPQTDIVSGANGHDDIDHLVDRLGVRFGTARVKRLGFAESHIPEYAVVEAPARGGALPALVLQPHPQDSICERPLRMLERPEEVEAIAEIPDGPPARFKWRRVMHEVAATEGPERIATEWWRDTQGRPLTRDYFRVEDKDGRRFWLYREGLYGRETARPRWFVHGLFA